MNDERLKEKIEQILPAFNEKQKRLFLGSEANALGYGGVSKISKLSGISRPTITQGIKELESKILLGHEEGIRGKGGGPKSIHRKNKSFVKKILKIVDPDTVGDPMSPLKWTTKSTREISSELSKKGFSVSHKTISTILKDLDYSLQSNEKSLSKEFHPDRDKQFRYINRKIKEFFKNNDPVISVDAKKKEHLGNRINKGKEWRPKKNPRKVDDHDFPDFKMGVAIPYGVYDIRENLGWVNVGTDHETSVFAVESIYRWWKAMGGKTYNNSTELLICADGGGSNGSNRRLWKYELQKLSNKLKKKITICHLPPGTSKWNKIEHKLFSFISMNWKGQPLVNHDVVINLISNTTTKTGLKVKATLDKKKYPTGIKVSNEEFGEINIKHHRSQKIWNYTISPNSKRTSQVKM